MTPMAFHAYGVSLPIPTAIFLSLRRAFSAFHKTEMLNFMNGIAAAKPRFDVLDPVCTGKTFLEHVEKNVKFHQSEMKSLNIVNKIQAVPRKTEPA